MKLFGQILLGMVLLIITVVGYREFIAPILEPRVLAAPPKPAAPPPRAIPASPSACRLAIEEERKRLQNLEQASSDWERNVGRARESAKSDRQDAEEHCRTMYQVDPKRYSGFTQKNYDECMASAREKSSRPAVSRNPHTDFIGQLRRKISIMQSQCR